MTQRQQQSQSSQSDAVNATSMTTTTTSSSTLTSSTVHPLIAGFVGGVVSTTLLLPLDVIKVRLQVDENTASSGNDATAAKTRPNQQHRLGTVRVLRGIVRHEGLRGLYQGWTPAVVGSAVSWGGYFYLYEGMKRRLVERRKTTMSIPTATKRRSDHTNASSAPPSSGRSDNDSISGELTSFDHFWLACLAGGIMVFGTNPIWLIKTRMQLQMKKASAKLKDAAPPPYRGMFDAGRTIIREEGPMALYKGTGAALLLTTHGGVQFVVYEYLRKHFHRHRYYRYGVGDADDDEVGGRSGKGSAATAHQRQRESILRRLELSSGYLTMGAVSKM